MSVEIPIHIFLKSVYVSRVLQKNVLCVNIIFVLANFKTLTARYIMFKIHIDLKANNVVERVICKKCNNIVYVGKTGATLYQRHVLNV